MKSKKSETPSPEEFQELCCKRSQRIIRHLGDEHPAVATAASAMAVGHFLSMCRDDQARSYLTDAAIGTLRRLAEMPYRRAAAK